MGTTWARAMTGSASAASVIAATCHRLMFVLTRTRAVSHPRPAVRTARRRARCTHRPEPVQQRLQMPEQESQDGYRQPDQRAHRDLPMLIETLEYHATYSTMCSVGANDYWTLVVCVAPSLGRQRVCTGQHRVREKVRCIFPSTYGRLLDAETPRRPGPPTSVSARGIR